MNSCHKKDSVSAKLNSFADWIESLPIVRIAGIVVIFATITAFWVDMSDRKEERVTRAWQLLTTKAPGNSGKIEAIEYLNSESWFKKRESLTGIDLSYSENGRGAYLKGVSLPFSDLTYASMQKANLVDANFTEANLTNANLSKADLGGAFFKKASLSGVNLEHSNFSNVTALSAFFEQTNLRSAWIDGSRLNFSLFWGTRFNDASIKYSLFFGCDMPYAVLDNANIEGSYFIGTTNLTCEQLTKAKNWETTFRDKHLSCGKPIPEMTKGDADLLLKFLPQFEDIITPQITRWGNKKFDTRIFYNLCELSRSAGLKHEHICDIEENTHFFNKITQYNKKNFP